MEWWILSGLVVAILAAAVIARMFRSRRRTAGKETGNIYPLW
jgi:hypothetical protein